MSIFEENRKWLEETKYIEDSDDILEIYQNLIKKWTISENSLVENALINFGIDDINNTGTDVLNLKFIKEKTIVDMTWLKLKKTVDDPSEYIKDFDRIYEVIFYSERLLRDIYLLKRTNDKKHDPLNNEDPVNLFKYSRRTDDSKKTPFQSLLLYLIDESSEVGYKKFGSNFYLPIISRGYNTHAWSVSCSIKDFISNKTDCNFHFNQWKNATADGGNNMTKCENYFKDHKIPEIPDLVKDRHLFSFRNGNYITKYNINEGTDKNPEYKDIFVPYGTKHPYIDSNSIACKYHDIDFDNFEQYSGDSWFKIIDHCPTFKHILEYQEFSREVQEWFCVFMGRICFKIGEMENWQVLFYLLGQAGSGKSTVLTKIVQKWFDESDVGIISNNIDQRFGIKPHKDKFLILAPEIDDKFKMEQTDWQLLVEGGRNTYSQKFKDDETIDWRVPLLMGGNKLMGFRNNSGSVSRRTVIARFSKLIKNTDNELDKKLEKELPYILKMCVSGFHHALKKYGTKQGIWNILPVYFHENKEDMEKDTNSLQHFIKCGNLSLGKDLYMPLKIFQECFKEHCSNNNFPKEKFTKDTYDSVFANHGIKLIQQGTREYPPKSGAILKRVPFCIGIDVANTEQSNVFVE
tara:strand:- start:394 stop:2289 length:1896 start_codon:yes stop_codon:yes gene_type:complete